jgi:hypothetical protein
MLEYTGRIAEESAERWRGGLTSLLPPAAKMLNALGTDVAKAAREFDDEPWIME